MSTDNQPENQCNESSRLLSAMKALAPGAIYSIAPREAVTKAMAELRRAPISRIAWSADQTSLRFRYSGHPVRKVSLSLVKEALTARCNCRMATDCFHRVVALVTLKKIVSPESFRHLPFDKAKVAELSRSVFGQPEPPVHISSPRLIVERRGFELSLHLDAGTIHLNQRERRSSAAEIRFRNSAANTHRHQIIQLFCEIFGSDAPIVFRANGTELPLRFVPDARRTAVTQVDLTAGVVTVRKAFHDEWPLPKDSCALPQYHFDLQRGTIEPIADSRGWRFWEGVYRAVGSLPYQDSEYCASRPADMHMYYRLSAPSNREVTVRMDDFNRLRLEFPNDDACKNLILTVNGAEAGVEERAMTGELHISPWDGKNQIEAFCRMNAGGTVLSLSSSPFGSLTASESWRIGILLKAKKRYSVLIATCFDLLHCHTEKERKELLKAAFTGADFKKRAISTEAKRFATSFADAGETRMLMTDGKGWVRYVMDNCSQSRLLEIPFRLFGASIFDHSRQPGELCLTRTNLLPRLHDLQTAVEAAGYRMLFGGRSIRSVKWEVTLDATRSTIDWFELRPEVRCEGGEVTAAEMEEALKGGGLYVKNGEIVMLDSDTSAVLSIFPAREESHSKKNQPVIIPRLQILDWLHLRKKGVTVRLSPEDERIFSSLASFEGVPPTPLPEKIDATLRQYQIDGYHWLAFLYTHKFGACLADDMGLGKTVQAIALLAGLHEGKVISHARDKLPHLIVVPPTLLFNWEGELARFYPGLRIRTYRGADRSAVFSGADIVLTSYGIVQRDAELLAALQFDVIVFDEAQAVKNIQTATTGACRKLKSMFSLTLTGTPVENHLGEYYSVMDISVPGLLGEYNAFRRRMDETDGKFLELLIRRTRPFLLRRTKTMIASELPPKIETDIYLDLTDKQRTLYTRTVGEVKATVEAAYRSKTAGQARIIALTAILRLRQLCLSPEILLPAMKESSPKIDFLIEQLEELFDEGHSVLVFSQFTRFLDIVEQRLVGRGLDYLRLDGSTRIGERKHLVNRFQTSENPMAFLLSLKAGGKGLNLTRATYVFHLDPWWNPAVEDQASDRAHRIGQTEQVTITRLLMRHTIEEKMMELKKRKLALYTALLEGTTSGGVSRISREDFDYLLA